MPTLFPFHFRPTRAFVATLAGGICLALGGRVQTAAAAPVASHLGVGATFDTLHVGSTVYRRVQVRSVNARTILFTYAGGLASVHLRDLPPSLQAAFGYDPRADAAAEAALDHADRETEARLARDDAAAAARPHTSENEAFDRLLPSLARAPTIRRLVDLRPRFVALGLNVRNQGPRPSCAVFAIVSALEYQNAQLTGRPERFSEEYLLWATDKILHRTSRPLQIPVGGAGGSGPATDPADEGFTLVEVVTALRAYGAPPLHAMPYTGGSAADLHPSRSLILAARTHRRVSVFALPGRDNATRVANLIHALNAGIPVAVGMSWPQYRTIRAGYLNGQQPLAGAGHAVTLVGYENRTGRIADTVFIFKNSWGAQWGAAGYGYATYHYVVRNLEDTVVLEVEPGANPAAAPAP